MTERLANYNRPIPALFAYFLSFQATFYVM